MILRSIWTRKDYFHLQLLHHYRATHICAKEFTWKCPPDSFLKLHLFQTMRMKGRKMYHNHIDVWISFNLISYFLILSIAILIKTKTRELREQHIYVMNTEDYRWKSIIWYYSLDILNNVCFAWGALYCFGTPLT